jgi:hypothetical protein
MNRLRLEYAAEAFLDVMRREANKQRPEDPVVVLALGQYPPAQRSALMKAVGTAIKVSLPENDNAFETWAGKRSAAAE